MNEIVETAEGCAAHKDCPWWQKAKQMVFYERRRADALTARIKELEAALRPFAQEAEGRDLEADAEPLFEVPHMGATKVTLGDCRRARAVIAAAPDTYEALKATAASLAAAISLLERAGKAAKKAAPSDTMFDMMISDYRKALDEARTVIAKAEGRK